MGKIYFIGMPGCGKSFIGKQTAETMGLPFIDLDEAIVDSAGATINQIFQQKGEIYFRELEARLLREISDKNNEFLMATGGGAPCFHGNMDYINEQGLSVFLNIPLEKIAAGLLSKGIEERPLLRDFDRHTLMQELSEKFTAREQFYRKAKLTIVLDHWDAEKTTNMVKEYIRKTKEA